VGGGEEGGTILVDVGHDSGFFEMPLEGVFDAVVLLPDRRRVGTS